MKVHTHYLADIHSLLAGERPGGVVWTADLSYWISGRQADGTADPAWQTERGYLELHRSLGVMPYYYYERFWTGRAVYHTRIRERIETAGAVSTHLWETPVGALREERRYLCESACHGVTRHPVETAADLDILLYLLEHRSLKPNHLGDYRQRSALWAEYDGLPCLGLPRSPLSALAGDMDIKELRALAGSDQTILWGGVPGVMFAPPYTWEDMRRHVMGVLESWQGQPFVLGVADQVPPDGDIGFCRKIADLLHKEAR